MPTETIGPNTGDDFTGLDDSPIDSSNATTNYASADTWSWDGSWVFRLLINFTGLSNISSSNTVSAASLNLWMTFAGASHTIEVHEILQAVVYAEATWNKFASGGSGTDWGTAGAASSGTDIAASSSDSKSQGTTEGYQNWSSDGIKDLVQKWVTTPSTNHGARLRNATASSDRYYRLSDWAIDGEMPFLSATHEAAGWTGKINRVTNPAKNNAIAVAVISKVNRVA